MVLGLRKDCQAIAIFEVHLFYLLIYLFAMLGIKPRALPMLGKCPYLAYARG
jgi:hypothetical protein